ncbi:MAG: phage tail tape measure protein [Butyrivibrio sp.]|nr:phage tail tape measure protein [Acetatifactor muris]MCM1560962.1 phage tail tape measure protein [Butyrivibrio sp.]
MAEKGTIGGKIVLEGEKQFRETLKAIKADQAELRSEMKLCQSEFKTSQNSLEALTKKHEILTKTIDSQTGKVEVYRKAMEFCAQKQEQAAGRVEELQTALDREKKALETLQESSEDNSQAVEAQTKVIAELTQKLSQAEAGYTKAEQKTKSYQTALNNASAELNAMQSDLDATNKYMAEAEAAADKCAVSIDQYGKETQEASAKTNIFGNVLKANLASEVIIEGVKKIATGIKEIADSAIETGSDFEDSMSQVAATMGMTVEEIESGSEEYKLLEDAAKKCGKTTKYSASESAEALNYLALAGYNARKSAETMPKVLNLAAAGSLGLAHASDLVTDSMAALNLETDKLDNYIDQIAKTSQKSNTSIAQLGEATLVCAGTVSMTKQSLVTMNAELGVLANVGLKGAEGGTHLRNVILSLSAPTEKAAGAIKELGLQINDSSGNMRDLNDILTDMDAAMEGMSSSEKTNIINQIFNKTDIAAVNALLKGTGGEFANLVSELENCSGAAADMAATMNNNLKGKVTILKSSLEALGISAYEIFDDDMKKAVDGATDAVGRLQKSIDRGNLGVSLNKMSKALGEFVENAIDAGEDALPVVIDAFTWILDNADLIIAGVTGIAAANFQMKTVGPAIEAAQAAWTAYKTETEGATVSQWLLNAAMDASPAGILVTAVVGLTAAVGAYFLLCKESVPVMDETTKKTWELIEGTRELNAAYESSASERQQSREEMESEAAQVKKLTEELKTLAEKTDKTRDEETRMKMIVEQLNQIVPELNLAINEQTGELNMSTEAIEKNIDAMMAMSRAEAAREDLAKIAEEQYEAEKKLAELRAQEVEQYKLLEQAEEDVAKAYEKIRENQGDLVEYYNTEQDFVRDQIKSNYDILVQQISETEATINGLGEEYAETMSYISEQTDIAQAATEELGAEAVATAEDFSTMETEVTDAVTEMYNSVYDSVTSQINLFAEFRGEAELSTKELLSNMQSQVDGITQWAENLEKLADRGINQGLLQHLAALGPEGAGYVATFAEMTDEELQKANQLFAESLVLSDDTAGKVAEAYEKAGQNAAGEFRAGIESSREEINAAAGDVAEGTVKEAEDALDIGTYSGEFEKVGERTDLGLAEGIKNNRNIVTAEVESLCSAVLKAGQIGINKSEWTSLGRKIPEGMAEGIASGTNAVTTAVEKMVAQAVSTAREGLEINSPSKKFEYMGEMSGDGYIIGWQQSMAGIDDKITNALPDTSMPAVRQQAGTDYMQPSGRQIEVQQEINIYALENDPLDAAKKLKEAQREAAELW